MGESVQKDADARARQDAKLRNGGFRRLAPIENKSAQSIGFILHKLSERSGYSVHRQGSEIWIRDSQPLSVQLITMWAKSAAGSASRATFRTAVEHYVSRSLYSRDEMPRLALDEAIRQIEQCDGLTSDSWNRLRLALFLAQPPDLETLLADFVCPFVAKHRPTAQLRVLQADPGFEKRFSALRFSRALSHFADQELQTYGTVPQSLFTWHLSDPRTLALTMLEWLSCITFPHLLWLEASAPGFHVLFVDEETTRAEPTVYPTSWLELLRSGATFGAQSRSDMFPRAEPDRTRALFQRYVWARPTSGIEVFLEWAIERTNAVARLLTNLCAYERPVDHEAKPYPDGKRRIDLMTPFEQLLTVDRIVRRTLALQCADARVVTKGEVFEIAEMWLELGRLWKSSHPNATEAPATRLFSVAVSKPHLTQALAKIPSPWGARFSACAEEVLDELLAVVMKSVWCTSRVRAHGVDLEGDGRAESVEPWDEFVEKLLRNLRNTLHGYTGDMGQKRTRLILSTGDVPDGISILPSLWLLSFLVDPSAFLGWPGPDH